MTEKNVEKNKSNEQKEKIRNIYLVDYIIKDLTLNKIIETNLPEKVKGQEKVIVFKGEKPIFEKMGNLFPKVEETLFNLKDGEEKTLKLGPIDAYGLRNKEMLRIVPLSTFKENKINPFVGLTIQTEDLYGTVRSVSGGRIMVDFNSPYSDHDIEVYVKKKKTLNNKEKIETILKNFLEKTNAKLESFENEKIIVSLKLAPNTNFEMYKEILNNIFKTFVEYKDLEVKGQ